jgi:hypothetical protein
MNETSALSFPITFRINNPEEVGDVLMKAFSIALSGKPGPVYVEIPLDIVNSDVEHAAKQQYNIERIILRGLWLLMRRLLTYWLRLSIQLSLLVEGFVLPMPKNW